MKDHRESPSQEEAREQRRQFLKRSAATGVVVYATPTITMARSAPALSPCLGGTDPDITCVDPAGGQCATSPVTIIGCNFDSTPANNSVSFNEHAGMLVDIASPTQLIGTLEHVAPNSPTGPVKILTGTGAPWNLVSPAGSFIDGDGRTNRTNIRGFIGFTDPGVGETFNLGSGNSPSTDTASTAGGGQQVDLDETAMGSPFVAWSSPSVIVARAHFEGTDPALVNFHPALRVCLDSSAFTGGATGAATHIAFHINAASAEAATMGIGQTLRITATAVGTTLSVDMDTGAGYSPIRGWLQISQNDCANC